jgi:hypothetical protein
LEELDLLPRYISVETECIGEKDVLTENEILGTLIHLYKLGYNKFKLIDQVTLQELLPNSSFYGVPNNVNRQMLLSQKLRYPFREGSSGPFGKLLGPKWLTYKDAIDTILFHREQFFSSGTRINYAFWCDWHATY